MTPAELNLLIAAGVIAVIAYACVHHAETPTPAAPTAMEWNLPPVLQGPNVGQREEAVAGDNFFGGL